MIKNFLKEYTAWLFAYALLVVLLGAVFALYRLPLDYFWVAASFSVTVLILELLVEFFRFRKRLFDIADLPNRRYANELKRPLDQAYLAVLQQSSRALQETVSDYKERDDEMQMIIKLWAHQMKVPLSALSLMSQTNSLSKMDVDSQLLTLNQYVANLLNYQRLTSQVSDFRFEEVDVRALLVELVKQYRVHFLHKNLSVTITGDWTVKSDRKWLRFVIGQVLDNAIKYSHPGGAVVLELAGGIRIQDEGIGILPEDVPRLFEQGFTGFNGREHQKATGLGLYMAKRVLDLLELQISVESVIDRGTNVRIFK